jgi:hypothetical protein
MSRAVSFGVRLLPLKGAQEIEANSVHGVKPCNQKGQGDCHVTAAGGQTAVAVYLGEGMGEGDGGQNGTERRYGGDHNAPYGQKARIVRGVPVHSCFLIACIHAHIFAKSLAIANGGGKKLQ